MAKITTYYNLASINDTKEFLGIAKDKSEGNIITTLEKNIVVVIQISSQKQIYSWTSFDKFSTKVLYDPKSQKYVGVFGQCLRCWDETTKDLSKVKKISIQRSIVTLVQNGDDGELLVLYASGETESLSLAIANRKKSSKLSLTQATITDCNIYPQPNGTKILTYFESSEGTVSLVLATLDAEDLKTTDSRKYKIQRGDIPLSGCCVIATQNFFEFISIWSDKRVFIQNLNNISSSDIVGHFISMLTTLDVDKPMSVMGLSDHCVAIYGANSVQEGASLILYNTQFKVVQAQQFFKVHFEFSRLWFFHNSIVLAMGQNLSVVCFKLTRQLLSELIGTQVQIGSEERIGDDFINEDYELEEKMEYVGESSNIMSSFEEPTLGNVDTTPSTFADGLTVPFYPMKFFDRDIETALNSSGFKVSLVESDDFGITFNSEPFPTPEIEIVSRELESRGASEQEIVEKILHVLIQAERFQDILVCLRRYTCIPENMLIRTLMFVLRSNQDSNELKRDVIKSVISCSFDEGKLAQYIRSEFKDISKVLEMLEILYELITSPEFVLEERAESGFEFDEEMQILKWVGVFLGTHFQQFLLSRDDNILIYLKKWMNLVEKFRNNVKDLQDISKYLYKVFEPQSNSSDISYSKWYSIEEIKLF